MYTAGSHVFMRIHAGLFAYEGASFLLVRPPDHRQRTATRGERVHAGYRLDDGRRRFVSGGHYGRLRRHDLGRHGRWQCVCRRYVRRPGPAAGRVRRPQRIRPSSARRAGGQRHHQDRPLVDRPSEPELQPCLRFGRRARLYRARAGGASGRSDISQLSISGNISTTGQISGSGSGRLCSTVRATISVKADVRYLDTKRSTWGLGPLQPESGESTRWTSSSCEPVRHGVPPHQRTGVRRDRLSLRRVRRHRRLAGAEQGKSTPFTEYSGGAPTQHVASPAFRSTSSATRATIW